MARSAFRRRLTGLTVVPLLLLGACAGEDALDADGGDSGDSGNGGDAKGEVVIGGQNYTEMQIMSEVYKQVHGTLLTYVLPRIRVRDPKDVAKRLA